MLKHLQTGSLKERRLISNLARIGGSRLFLQLSMFLIILGTAWFIYFTFVDKTNSQDMILNQLVANNNQVNELRAEVANLRDTNSKLLRNVCVLQHQIEQLGAKPAVIENCNDL